MHSGKRKPEYVFLLVIVLVNGMYFHAVVVRYVKQWKMFGTSKLSEDFTGMGPQLLTANPCVQS